MQGGGGRARSIGLSYGRSYFRWNKHPRQAAGVFTPVAPSLLGFFRLWTRLSRASSTLQEACASGWEGPEEESQIVTAARRCRRSMAMTSVAVSSNVVTPKIPRPRYSPPIPPAVACSTSPPVGMKLAAYMPV